MTILAERDLTDAEREAVADEPRPGFVRGFTDPIPQHATDVLIACELRDALDAAGKDELMNLIGNAAHAVRVGPETHWKQRGGIHSEPLVRLLAFRAWGDRDRKWFEPTTNERCPSGYWQYRCRLPAGQRRARNHRRRHDSVSLAERTVTPSLTAPLHTPQLPC